MTSFVYSGDGVAFHVLGVPVRYYGIAIVATLWSGFYIWLRQARSIGLGRDVALRWLNWGALGVLVGARLGHCLFYEPAYYLQHIVEILKLWEGGAASHGAALGIVASSALYARRYRLPVVEVLDQLALVMPAASFMRLGNFMNSEIVGTVTNVPWAIKFSRYADGGAFPRHPTQLYEFLLGVSVFILAFVLDLRLRRLKRRPQGLLLGSFLVFYFVCRFLVEYAKADEYAGPVSVFTMGQLLCIPSIAAGAMVLLISLRGGFGYYRTATVPARQEEAP
jgi:prolipoprotein diacylglyceryl transferase